MVLVIVLLKEEEKMFATVRADFYRLFRTKGFWISQILLILFIFSSIAGQNVATVGVNSNETISSKEAAFSIEWTGVISVNAITSMMPMFLYFMLPLLVIIIGHDFTKETYKNILTVGVSRTKYFFSQFISFAFMIFVQIVYIYSVSFLTGTLFYGVGDGFDLNQIKDWLFTGMIQFILIMAILTISCLIMYLTKNNVLAVIIAVAFPLIPSLFTLIFPNVSWIKWFDFQGLMTDPNLILSGVKEVGQTSIVAIVTIVGLLLLTTRHFNRMEL